MKRVGGWAVLRSRWRHIHEVRAADRKQRRLRRDLERLLSAGDHLIRDIGLDPRLVRQWLRNDG
ncbi:hypothetical protein [Microvirga rosea]|uniref:hypothetical protein n=1 Tax=Microvirga rosea TaxID=2715425 RepID=UPI001D0B4AAC|nr:hypothetical protein [Microvirga rosea]MCB8819193.1 hypothetical protein [Microvirga rosea]